LQHDEERRDWHETRIEETGMGKMGINEMAVGESSKR
jgi:hypothetical protein